MAEPTHHKQSTFKSLLLKQLFIAIAIGLLITIPLVSIPAYVYFNQSIKNDIANVEEISYEAINTHLATGWQKHNITEVYRDIRQAMPNALLFLQKAPDYIDSDDDKLNPDSAAHVEFIKLIEQVQLNERTIIDSNIFNKTINAAIPIKFKNECLVCHAAEVSTGQIYTGALGGTMVMQVPMSVELISTTSVIVFFVLFILIFTVIAAFVTNKLVQTKLLSPLELLDGRVKRLRLTSHQRKIDWQRTPQNLIEIDHIDQSISEHIDILKAVYQRLDNLMLTEHEVGLFHKDRFNQVLKYELARTKRYQHACSLVIIQLEKVRVLNASAKNLESETPGSKYLTFGEILHNDTRSSDMTFRLEETIFAILAPETDSNGAQTIKRDIYRRLISNELPVNEQRKSALPEYEFSIKMGSAVFEHDAKVDAKTLLKTGLENMQESTLFTGFYPPKLND